MIDYVKANDLQVQWILETHAHADHLSAAPYLKQKLGGKIGIGDQIKAGTPQYAMYGFAVFYALCLILNWWFYLRANAYVKNP